MKTIPKSEKMSSLSASASVENLSGTGSDHQSSSQKSNDSSSMCLELALEGVYFVLINWCNLP